MTDVAATPEAEGRPAPRQAIDARRRDTAIKVTAVGKAVKAVGRTGVPVTRAGVARLAGVSRSFTYENHDADTMITAAQSRTQALAGDRDEKLTAQQQAAWQERALNAEDQVRHLRRELGTQHQLVGDLLGQLREPNGTWIQEDRDRLRQDNEHLRYERNQFLRDRDDLHRKLDGARANVSRLT
ncbi:hypothetical protein K6U06_05730 [Acidiferrimicrobium sp. IK]|uniref:DUF6262 family protein n=1 Tax=Acidiferrimicrobium sp. IK TaxID=2871700 RepID=UPI0021CB2CB2|nr:DUF6262 family protein [Acidiferrimicrobium sp. IK]MCU4183852.1 hypothetical protein [Acidiferrimicrobium sp. IK]